MANTTMLASQLVSPQGLPWIVPGWLCGGRIHILAGQTTTGKSLFALSLAANLTRGKDVITGRDVSPLRCAYLSGEEHKRQDILPRFIAANGDTGLLHILADGSMNNIDDVVDDITGHKWREAPPLGLIVIDDIASLVEDLNNNTQVRRLLSKCSRLAELCKASLLGITHVPKGASSKYTSPVDYTLGCQAWTAVPRMSWIMVRDESRNRENCIMVRVSNLPHPNDTALRIHAPTQVSLGVDDDNFPVEADKLDKYEIVGGDPLLLFGAAIGDKKALDMETSKNSELCQSVLNWIKQHGDEEGYVSQIDLLASDLAPERKIKAAIKSLDNSTTIIRANGKRNGAGGPRSVWWRVVEFEEYEAANGE